jgi:hypothetical protein
VDSTSIPALDLPIQFFALGMAVGMLAALVNYHRTGDLELWPVYVAYLALVFFAIGLLVEAWGALDRAEMKSLTARHFLFYMGVVCVVVTAVAITTRLLDLSNGLTFAIAALAATIVAAVALRESLFSPTPRPAGSGPTRRPFLSYVGIACMAAAVLWSIAQVLNGSYGISVAVLLLAGLIASTPGLREDLFAPSRHAKAPHRGRRT